MPDPSFGYGYLFPNDRLGKFNPTAFLVSQMLSRVRTITLAKVMSVTNSGTDIPAGTVDVQPLVSMVDGIGNATSHGTVYKIPYFRFQSGANALIMDPVVGDIGIMLVCDRDISAVKASRQASAPPSGRAFDFSDGLFIGGVLGAVTPTQYTRFDANGMTISDANGNTITMSATGINIQPAPGKTVTIDGIVFETHIHSGVTTGSDDSGPPV